MGFIKAFTGALSGTLADQWKDFYVPRADVPATAAVFQAIPQSQNNGRGENYKGNENIISNGSKIVVPEGTALITIQDGQITGIIAEPGGYEFKSDDPNSQSIFAGDGIIGQTIKSTWEKVKFGGQPGSQQLAFYVNLKEISGIRFGTPAPIQWNDTFFETKVGAMAKGTYSLKLVDPLLFVKNFVPIKYLQPGASYFDFNDVDNDATTQLFNEFMRSLSAGFSNLSIQAKSQGLDTYDYISTNAMAFSKTLNDILETDCHWKSNRGLEIITVAITMEYDAATMDLLEEIRRDDKEIRKQKKMGEAYGNNMAGMMAAASGQAMQAAAANENGAMMGFMGMNMAQQGGANMLGAVSNMQQAPVQAAPVSEDPTEKLLNAKKLLDAGAISQEDYDKLKAQLLGI